MNKFWKYMYKKILRLFMLSAIYLSTSSQANFQVADPVFSPSNFTTATRPTCPSDRGCFGYNTDLDKLEYWDGTVWGILGNILGPATAVDNVIAVFNGTTGKVLKGTSYAIPVADGSANQVLKTNGSGTMFWADDVDTFATCTGDVQGPVSSVAGNLAYYTDASGKILGSNNAFNMNTTDNQIVVGDSAIGNNPGLGGTWACVGNKAWSSSGSSYSMCQRQDGKILINAPTGQTVGFGVNDITQMLATSTGVSIEKVLSVGTSGAARGQIDLYDGDSSNKISLYPANDVTADYNLILPPAGPPGDNYILQSNQWGDLSWIATPGGGGGGGGDVVGPASSVDNSLAIFSGTTGKSLKEIPELKIESDMITYGESLNPIVTITGFKAISNNLGGNSQSEATLVSGDSPTLSLKRFIGRPPISNAFVGIYTDLDYSKAALKFEGNADGTELSLDFKSANNHINLRKGNTGNYDYTLTFPITAPAANQVMRSDATGNLSWVPYTNPVFFENKIKALEKKILELEILVNKIKDKK